MEIIATLALALGASWCAGINLYATVFVLGALHRYTGFELPAGMEPITSDWVLWPSLFLYCVEFVADKVPAVDSAWDTVHTFLRVPAGAVLAATALGDVPMEFQLLAGLLGGSLALASHTTKATTRLALHGSGGSLAAPIVSVGEDVLVVAAMGLVAANPVLSLFIVAVMMVAAYYILKAFWGLAKRVANGLRSLFGGGAPAEPAAG
ncbi:MAG: DUF4126 domain-containing protein [Candidatus Sumerlaeia bacterium]|nr:DUF4126 domain-containing protein [Candidatus Sumerlaeia bacterium]